MGVGLAIAAGGLSALSSISQTRAMNAQARYQADVASANADAMRQNAKIAEEKGRIAAENFDRERDVLRREYADLQAGNVAQMGGLGVDLSSGSVQKTLTGNANRFAADVGLNRYQKSLSEWETRQNVRNINAQADQYDAMSSYYKSTVKGLGNTLLTAGLSGLTSGLGMYSMTNGLFGGASGNGNWGVLSKKRYFSAENNLL